VRQPEDYVVRAEKYEAEEREGAGSSAVAMIGAAQIFTIFFVTLGPLKLLGPFVQRTRGIDEATTRQIAW